MNNRGIIDWILAVKLFLAIITAAGGVFLGTEYLSPTPIVEESGELLHIGIVDEVILFAPEYKEIVFKNGERFFVSFSCQTYPGRITKIINRGDNCFCE